MEQNEIKARDVSFFHDLFSVAGRAIRSILREPESFIPGIIVPLFFFMVNVGALSDISQFTEVENFEAFQLPVAIVFAVTGISRASALVIDIQNGYFDRLLISPVSRVSLLLGLMMADLFFVIALTIPVILLGFALGVTFASGPLGLLLFIIISGLWGLVFTGFPYTIALRTGSPAAVNSSFILFFPFAFLTTSFLPQEALTGWLATIADYNPVTYLLSALRSLIDEGFVWDELAKGLLAITIVGAISFGMAFWALKAKVKRG